MTTFYIRGQERLVDRNVGIYLLTQLTALGWFNVDAPFGATGPITLVDQVPARHTELVPNTMAFTSGPVQKDTELELGAAGGGLWVTEHVYFCDIFGESVGVADALAADVRAILTGRLSGTSRYQPLTDYSLPTPVVAVGHVIHFEDVETETLPTETYKRAWRVVKMTACHEYNAVETGGGP